MNHISYSWVTIRFKVGSNQDQTHLTQNLSNSAKSGRKGRSMLESLAIKNYFPSKLKKKN